MGRAWFWLVAPLLACWLLSAHFLRYGRHGAVAVCFLLPLVLLLRRRGAVRLLQAVLGFGALVWGWTAYELVHMRIAFGRPYGRLAIILAAVICLDAFAVYALQRWGRYCPWWSDAEGALGDGG